MKCTTKEITANSRRRWISPPATWKNKNPPAHIINNKNAINMNGPNLIFPPPVGVAYQ
jgi:hypothetical protein